MKVLTKEQILSATKAVRGGNIGRITYKTEVPIKSEFKKQGYKITKIVETSVRFGVNYHNISSVIARKNESVTTTRNTTNNYVWLERNRVKYNTNTHKHYLVVASLPVGHHTKVKYILEGSLIGTLDMGCEIDGPYKHIVLDSYLRRGNEYNEIRTISFENIITINKIGSKVKF